MSKRRLRHRIASLEMGFVIRFMARGLVFQERHWLGLIVIPLPEEALECWRLEQVG